MQQRLIGVSLVLHNFMAVHPVVVFSVLNQNRPVCQSFALYKQRIKPQTYSHFIRYFGLIDLMDTSLTGFTFRFSLDMFIVLLLNN